MIFGPIKVSCKLAVELCREVKNPCRTPSLYASIMTATRAKGRQTKSHQTTTSEEIKGIFTRQANQFDNLLRDQENSTRRRKHCHLNHTTSFSFFLSSIFYFLISCLNSMWLQCQLLYVQCLTSSQNLFLINIFLLTSHHVTSALSPLVFLQFRTLVGPAQ